MHFSKYYYVMLLLFFSMIQFCRNRDLILPFLPQNVFNGQAELQRGKERQREQERVFHLLFDSPNGNNIRDCDRSNPGTQNFLQVPHDCTGPSPWGIFCCLPRCTNRDLNGKWSCQILKQCPIGCQHLRDGSVNYSPILAPQIQICLCHMSTTTLFKTMVDESLC